MTEESNNMDKIIEKKTGWRVAFTKKAVPWWLGALLGIFIIYLIARPNNKTLRVDKDTLTVSTATRGEFNDYIRVSGRVQPMTTIQLSPQEGFRGISDRTPQRRLGPQPGSV